MKTKVWTWIGLGLLGAVAFFGALNNRQGVPYVEGDIDELAIHGAAQTYGEPRYWGDRFGDEPAAPLQASTSSRIKAWWARVVALLRAAIGGSDDQSEPVTPDPPGPVTPPPADPDPPGDVPPPVPAGDNTFLWKPVSETRQGRAAVLLPANITATTITVNGEAPVEYVGRQNGNRQQYFLGKTGSAYGSNVKVVAVGTGRQWTVPNGAARWGAQ